MKKWGPSKLVILAITNLLGLELLPGKRFWGDSELEFPY
jgi:hypothetical protein